MIYVVKLLIAIGLLSQIGYGADSIPVIFDHSETSRPGNIEFIQGSGFGTHPRLQYSEGNARWKSIVPLTTYDGLITFDRPRTWRRNFELFAVRCSSDGTRWSKPVSLNRARILSIDTDEVFGGSKFRIFGRSLNFGRGILVWLKDRQTGTTSRGIVDRVASSQYTLSVTAPWNILATHTYSIALGNQLSTEVPDFDSSDTHTLTGKKRGLDHWKLHVSWAADLDFYPQAYNGKTDPRLSQHATGDGVTDDRGAIKAAIDFVAKRGGGIVFLPTGHYKLLFSEGCGLALPPRVALVGAGRDLTEIDYGYGKAPKPEQGGYAVCFSSETGISDIALNNVNESGHWPQSGHAFSADNVFLQRITWNLGTSQWIEFPGTHHLSLQNSWINQSSDSTNSVGPLLLEGCVQCRISNNKIVFTVGGIGLDHSADVVFENNRVIRNIFRSPNPKSVTHLIAANFAKDLMILNNMFRSNGGGLSTNNDGEVLNSEGGGPSRVDEFRGVVSTSNSLTLTDPTQDFRRSTNRIPRLQTGVATIAIITGAAKGEIRSIREISEDGRTVTIDRPWDVTVPPGSHYATFDWSASQWIVAHNTLIGNFKGFEIFDASASDVFILSNHLIDSGGIMVSPTQNPPGVFNVIRKVEILNNVIEDRAGLRPAYIGIIPREDSQSESFGTSVMGALVRDNRIVAHFPNTVVTTQSWDDSKILSEGYLNYWCWQSLGPYKQSKSTLPILGTIFQRNTAENSSAAFVLNTGSAGTIIAGTFGQDVCLTKVDYRLPGANSGSTGTLMRDNKWQFASRRSCLSEKRRLERAR